MKKLMMIAIMLSSVFILTSCKDVHKKMIMDDLPAGILINYHRTNIRDEVIKKYPKYIFTIKTSTGIEEYLVPYAYYSAFNLRDTIVNTTALNPIKTKNLTIRAEKVTKEISDKIKDISFE